MTRFALILLGILCLAQTPTGGTIEGTWIDDAWTSDGRRLPRGRIVVSRRDDHWVGTATECRRSAHPEADEPRVECESFPIDGARIDGSALHFSVHIDYDGSGVKRRLPLRLRLVAPDRAELTDANGTVVERQSFSKHRPSSLRHGKGRRAAGRAAGDLSTALLERLPDPESQLSSRNRTFRPPAVVP